MKILKTILGGMLILSLTMGSAYAEHKGKGHEEKTHGQKENQSNERASGVSANPETRRHITEKGRNDAALRANIPDQAQNNSIRRANFVTREGRGRSTDRSAEKAAREKTKKFFNALEHARWSYNPHDTRGQGNMGKPRMRDPYGFDKDSGREGSERGRPIREPLLNLADIVSMDFMEDPYIIYMLNYIEIHQDNPDYAAYLESLLTAYLSGPFNVATNLGYTTTIDYTLTFSPPEEFEGTNLLVTTSVININDYTYSTGIWLESMGFEISDEDKEDDKIHYDAGQVLMEQTQEVVLGENNTFSFSYDPPTDLAGNGDLGLTADLVVTVSEPESGASYTMTYDRQLYLYRCPYGKVYNAKTRQPVVGAKVTVYFEDGSIVPLDKASNPTAKNPQTTDATGRYGVKLETNRKYYITAKADGYEDYKSEVFTEKWHVLREDIALTPLEQVASK